MVLARWRINDGMGRWVVEQLVLEMAQRGLRIAGTKVLGLGLGLSFKENCLDLRNTRVVDVLQALQRYGTEPVVVDPWVDPEEAQREVGLRVTAEVPRGEAYAAVVAAVAHYQFRTMAPEQWRELLMADGVIFDLKGLVPRQLEPIRL